MTLTRNLPKGLSALAVAAGFSAVSAVAGDPGGKMVMPEPPPAPEPWTICNLFDYPTLYSDDSNPYFQEFALIGRYHGQYHYTDGVDANEDSWENRRWRFGAEAAFFQDFEAQVQFNLNDSNGRFFEDFEEFTVGWEPSDYFYLTVGKQKAKITQEWATSSKRILTFERSLLVNQTVPEKSGGVVIGGDAGMVFWSTGVFTGDLTANWSVPDFDAGYGALASVGVHATELTDIRFDYFYNDGDVDNVAFEPQENTFSLNSATKYERFGINTDIIYATGGIDSTYGIVVIPYFDITDQLQGVFRYQWAGSDGDGGLRLQRRYERPTAVNGDRGDNYHAFYGGLNYRICGDKLKFMGGVEYADLSGRDSWDGFTYLAGIRLYF